MRSLALRMRRPPFNCDRLHCECDGRLLIAIACIVNAAAAF
ncbi:MAG: hypothetical protein RM347_024475 [Nostoc sp. ChiQUE02]|nr:hypothetical protein [Nostoc sp. ChiQUE02]